MLKSDSQPLIINYPYEEPTHHWKFAEEEGGQHTRVKGRRLAGYLISDPRAKPHQDKGELIELKLANDLRNLVGKWREEQYLGVTGVTKKLLEHWNDSEERDNPFFFCQMEAIETLIWLTEAPDSVKTRNQIPKDGGDFERLCSKLATGTGKTVVMAMLIAWQVINKITSPEDDRFSSNIFVVAPNLTVRERLGVLNPESENNYYDEFQVVPHSMNEKLRQAKVLIKNWHALSWDTEEKISKRKGVDKRGAKSDKAYIKEVLGELAAAENIIVINDEAHHAWKVSTESKAKAEEKEEATIWVGGLERIHKTHPYNKRILTCFDFSATPFAPSAAKTNEEALFGWIVSDFGLNEAIETGLVKTPRIVVRDDALVDSETYKSRLYHIYNDDEVKNDLNRKAKPDEYLPELVRTAYMFLGADWEITKKKWKDKKAPTPPVMITVANRTETAARIKYSFDNKVIRPETLGDPDRILHIDSKVIKDAEMQIEKNAAVLEKVVDAGDDDSGEKVKKKFSKKEGGIFLREQVNTVGQEDKPGAQIQNVISVGMLSEGWDAKTVTHIMGLRAFTSQLLCEQVVGRGLRRASYELDEETGLFPPEYVNVFGIPFRFLPYEDSDADAPVATPMITVSADESKKKFEITWPNVIRINRDYVGELSFDLKNVETMRIDVNKIPSIVEIAPAIDGKTDWTQIEEMNLKSLLGDKREQTLIFEAATKALERISPDSENLKIEYMPQLLSFAEEFIGSDKIQLFPELSNQDKEKRQIVLALRAPEIIQHFWEALSFENTEKISLVLDNDKPMQSTGDMRSWKTRKPCGHYKKSHIQPCVYDSRMEKSDAIKLDKHKAVSAWAKNDHLKFNIFYVHEGAVKKYLPDFLVRLASGEMLVVETKGQQTPKDDAKHKYMEEWVKAVNADGRYGKWHFKVTRSIADIEPILDELAS